MPAPRPPRFCSDCGAELSPGSTVCWLCAYQPPAALSPEEQLQAIAQQRRTQGQARPKTNVNAVVGLVLALIFILPATAVAFVASCLAVVVASGPRVSEEAALGTGLMGAVVCFLVMLVLIVQLAQQVRRK